MTLDEFLQKVEALRADALRDATHAADAAAWTETRNALVKEIEPLLAEGDKTEVRTEAAFWFTPPEPHVRKPKQWKQFLITLLVIFPSTNIVPLVTGALLPGLKGSLLLHLINDACVVALVVWLWMPIVTRLFAGWLKKA